MLEAAGIRCGIAAAGGEHVLLVPSEDADRAALELFKYVRENRSWPQDDEAPQLGWSAAAAVFYVLIVVGLDVAQRRELLGLDWWGRGIADAALIRGGAWWRSLTALGLHADFLHLAGNLAFGAAFGVMLAQSIGVGLAWLAFLLTGGVGNWLNAWLQSPSHTSIGASTAIFGMLGVQVAHDWLRRRQIHYNLFRRWAPLAVGAALLAWLGGDGRPADPTVMQKTFGDLSVPLPRIDVAAHLLGFTAGLAVGGLVGWSRPHVRFGARAQTSMAVAAAVLFGSAWWLAFR